jgi:hypothetical protein
MDLGGARVFAQALVSPGFGSPLDGAIRRGVLPGLRPGAGRHRFLCRCWRGEREGGRDPVGVNGWAAGARKAFGYQGASGAPSDTVLLQAGERSIGRMMPGG